MSRRPALAAAAVVAACVLAGCGGSNAPATGTLNGAAHVFGGADGQGVGAPAGGVEVDAISPASVATKAVSGADGRWSLTLAPGVYVLSACGQQVPVTVRAGQVTHHDVSCTS